MAFYEPLFLALNNAGARYVVVGGVATVLHGHARLTADVDLVIDLEPTAAARAMRTLTSLGLQPRLPVSADDFADPAKRTDWIRTRNMQVFSMVDPDNPMSMVDLFVDHPIDFDELWADSVVMQLDTTSVRVASIDHLIRLKRQAGRPKDLADMAALREIRRLRSGDSE